MSKTTEQVQSRKDIEQENLRNVREHRWTVEDDVATRQVGNAVTFPMSKRTWQVVVGGEVVSTTLGERWQDRPRYATQTVELEQGLLTVIRGDGAAWELRFVDGEPRLQREEVQVRQETDWLD